MVKKVLTIAGSDTWGGGGIGTDLKTFENFGVFGLQVITSLAVTQENSFRLIPLAPNLVSAQLKTIEETFPIDAVKIGYLGNIEIIDLVLSFLQKHQGDFPVVLDPVLAFKETTDESSKEYLEHLVKLFPFATLTTPNLQEAKLLLGKDNGDKSSLEDLSAGLFEKYQVPFYVKGGRRLQSIEASDFLITQTTRKLLTAPFSSEKTVNGAGCSLSSAIAASLALGFSLEKSTKISKKYVREAIEQGLSLGDSGNVWHQGKEAHLDEN